MNKQLQTELIEILEYFKNGLEDIEAGSGERQPMSDKIDDALGKVLNLPISGVVQQSELFTCKLEGGKSKCGYVSKDYMACVQLRKCPFASI
ncbi:hypothetical protein [Aequorivita echinoideorum]|uniref:Uncharacterized protein n=1 Tax=Aequorivita echinoideorum TaxID=1549647 RepID=A0ABS5S338_9FLAO|nr:hypothetical protein [Aequorivita echinoideorum]MBT0607627.1 hypothetical protein [Aequorivita echinoideorum]